MKIYLISDNLDTQTGFRLIGIDSVVVHKDDKFKEVFDSILKNKDVGILLITEKCADRYNDLLSEIAKNSSKVVYGTRQTTEAINLGAVSQLLILDVNVAEDNMGDLMDMTENMKGEVMVISSEHDGGKQLESLGGMAAILRYEIA